MQSPEELQSHIARPAQRVADSSLRAAAEIIASSRHVVAMTGAGMSVESGIPPFRGPDGLWTKHGAPSPSGYRLFLENPDAWWQREIERSLEPWVVALRESAINARPNAGHAALAGMESAGFVQCVITQNVDGLHSEAGSRNLIEFHGSRHKMRCAGCGRRTPRETMFFTAPHPPCDECGGPVKYDSVLFGEPIPPEVLSAARRATDAADCVVVIGSSMTVRPAGGLPRIARAAGAALVEVNPNETRLSASCDVVVRETAANGLPALLSALREC
ncbi:MAG: SIR2 family NAD-dependent protein deacylase, partial [Chloroflexota bacterium]